MPTFAAIKINYDHRPSIPPHLKYSMVPTLQEYNEYRTAFREENVGGNGFHECLNFAAGRSETLRFYLPPTSIPAEARQDEEFVFFSFTYKGDRDLPAHIIGVHAGARLVSREGLARGSAFEIEGVEPLIFHAEAPSDLVTLITPPLAYGVSDGLYTRRYSNWGNGLRYIHDAHAANIIRVAITQASIARGATGESEKAVIERQLDVLRRISMRYGLDVGENAEGPIQDTSTGNGGGTVDTEIGYRGERVVYEREVAYARELRLPPSTVEWTSQSAPDSPFDIQTVRRTPNGIRPHYIEVKSSSMAEGDNVYISSRQVAFFEQNMNNATFVLVNFRNSELPSIREVTLDELRAGFDFLPVKYKLSRRGSPSIKSEVRELD